MAASTLVSRALPPILLVGALICLSLVPTRMALDGFRAAWLRRHFGDLRHLPCRRRRSAPTGPAATNVASRWRRPASLPSCSGPRYWAISPSISVLRWAFGIGIPAGYPEPRFRRCASGKQAHSARSRTDHAMIPPHRPHLFGSSSCLRWALGGLLGRAWPTCSTSSGSPNPNLGLTTDRHGHRLADLAHPSSSPIIPPRRGTHDRLWSRCSVRPRSTRWCRGCPMR